MEAKRCIRCGVRKKLSAFQSKRNQCKLCIRELHREYQRSNRDKCRGWMQRYLDSDLGRVNKAASDKRRRAANPLKYGAREAVSNAIKSGRLVRGPCEVCGKTPAQAHHDDYRKPLKIRWLCFRHHRLLHALV